MTFYALFAIDAQSNSIGHLQNHMSPLLRELSYYYHTITRHRFPKEPHKSKSLLRMGSLTYRLFSVKTT
jgi:hypothetical protein